MELKDFIKTTKTQKFLHTSYGHVKTKAELTDMIKEKVMEWLAVDSSETEIKNNAISYVIRDYEPLTSQLKQHTNELLKKWGIT